jgi:hypothetical protein
MSRVRTLFGIAANAGDTALAGAIPSTLPEIAFFARKNPQYRFGLCGILAFWAGAPENAVSGAKRPRARPQIIKDAQVFWVSIFWFFWSRFRDFRGLRPAGMGMGAPQELPTRLKAELQTRNPERGGIPNETRDAEQVSPAGGLSGAASS